MCTQASPGMISVQIVMAPRSWAEVYGVYGMLRKREGIRVSEALFQPCGLRVCAFRLRRLREEQWYCSGHQADTSEHIMAAGGSAVDRDKPKLQSQPHIRKHETCEYHFLCEKHLF